MPLDLVSTLADLVSRPSVNPMGRPIEGGADIYYEHRVTDYLQQLFTRLGLPWERLTVAPQRDNIIARLDGAKKPDQGGRVVLLEAHQDTVPVEGMTIEPFRPDIKEGRMYGRGSCDIKGGMVAMLGALTRLIEERPSDCPTVIMACTVNEEHGFSGATALTKMWSDDAKPSIIPRRPDVGVIAEPTNLNVVIAHKGTIRWRITTHGKAAHSSQPHLGDNAIYKMSRVLQALETYAREVAPKLPENKWCGKATLSVGVISGGISVNTVPDRCTIEVDRRALPNEDAAEAYRHAVEFVNKFPGIDFEVEHQAPFIQAPSLPETHNGELAARLATAAKPISGGAKLMGVPYGTDASTIARSGVPSVVFGPGSIDQAHTIDEWLPLDELELASKVLYDFVRNGG